MMVENDEADPKDQSTKNNVIQCPVYNEQFDAATSSIHARVAISCSVQNVYRSCMVGSIEIEKKATHTRRKLVTREFFSAPSQHLSQHGGSTIAYLESARAERSLEEAPLGASESGSGAGGSRKRDSSGVINSSATKAIFSRNTATGITASRIPPRATLPDEENERKMEVVWVKYQAKAAWWPGIIYDPMLAPQGEMREDALLHKNSKVWRFFL